MFDLSESQDRASEAWRFIAGIGDSSVEMG